MGYRIEGDGTWQNTKIWRDNEPVDYQFCAISIEEKHGAVAVVDGNVDKLDRAVIKAIYMLVSDGEFNNSKVLFNGEVLR
jgi:hypothetical protein